jgi:tetratricopeptide (TPR) repeat protein
MGRLLVVLLLLTVAAPAQLKERNEKNEAAAVVEEDEDLVSQTEYAFNPIQAQKDLKIGDFYAKKGNHRAAVARYLEATKWNPGFAEAYWKMARSRDKLDQPAQALEAYRRFAELEPDSKLIREARKRIAELEAQQEKLPVAHEASAAKEGDKAGQGEKAEP